ncbi:MAG: PrsW family intramembrane metalloprotease [Spirochaetaceae bacterium]|jgi:RsiW-degrading membrane proteinase PrsW (M82 family)|nr:PrsW family intramembrane metalloprotease [Spirochaetaceae bacterium]
MWVLALLLGVSALPVLPAYFWLRARKFPLTPLWFLLSLLAGAASLFIAALIQSRYTALLGARESGFGMFVFHLFVRIALTEEAGRGLALFGFFCLMRAFKRAFPVSACFDKEDLSGAAALGGATGLLAGLGFALVETASYGTGAADITLALTRSVTAAPLHGACGIRVGMAAALLGRRPVHSALRFLSAAALHGMYNFMVLNPRIPRALPLILAFLALFSSLQAIKSPPPAGAPPAGAPD